MKEIIVAENESGQRLDNYLQKLFPKLARSHIYKAVRNKKIKVNRKRAQYNQILLPGDHILLFLAPDVLQTDLKAPPVLPAPEIVMEDPDYLVMNKPAGLLSQKDSSDDQDSLNGRLLWYLYQSGDYLKDPLSSFTPSVAHRLDRNTSGLVLAGKNAKSSRQAAQEIQSRMLKKKYLAVTEGIPREGHYEMFLKKEGTKALVSDHEEPGFQPASMDVHVLSAKDGLALIECDLETGRFHQIRAMLAKEGHPLFGDRKYGSDAEVPYALHAYQMDFSNTGIPLGTVEVMPRWNGKAAELLKLWLNGQNL